MARTPRHDFEADAAGEAEAPEPPTNTPSIMLSTAPTANAGVNSTQSRRVQSDLKRGKSAESQNYREIRNSIVGKFSDAAYSLKDNLTQIVLRALKGPRSLMGRELPLIDDLRELLLSTKADSIDSIIDSDVHKSLFGHEHEEIEKSINRIYHIISSYIDYARSIVGTIIEEKDAEDISALPRAEKNLLMNRFTAEFPGAPIDAYIAKLFPEREVHPDRVNSLPDDVDLPARKQKTDRRVAKVEAEDKGAIGNMSAKDASKFYGAKFRRAHQPPEIARQPSPDGNVTKSAPEHWASRRPDDTPISFIKRNFGIWRNGAWDPNGLTKPDLRHDMQLYQALASYERRHPDEALNLPTKKQVNDAWVDRVLNGEEHISGALETERFAQAAKRRGKGSRAEHG